MWLAFIPFTLRVWALPILTVLAPSERYYQTRGKRPRPLTEVARQLLLQLRRWLPHRALVLVADSSYAVLALLHCCQSLAAPIVMVARLRLDAALYAPAPPRQPGQRGRPRLKGHRLPTLTERLQDPATAWETVTVPWYDRTERTLDLASDTAVWYHAGQPPVPLRWVLIRDPLGEKEPQALLCTDPSVPPAQIVAWFVQRPDAPRQVEDRSRAHSTKSVRWQLEVMFEEARRHLGVETQSKTLGVSGGLPVRAAAWYVKALPTFADAIAVVRRHLWPSVGIFLTSGRQTDTGKLPRVLVDHLVGALAYAT